MVAPAPGERLQKVLSRLGLGSRREAEAWIRAGRLTVNGRPAVLGMRVSDRDQLKLDGRTIRQAHAATEIPVFLCHRSPGEPLLPGGSETSLAERLPRRAGRRFISVSPMPMVDGGLELLTADGAIAERLQRAVHRLESEYSLRVRGELSPVQEAAILEGQLDSGARLKVRLLQPAGGESSNRWYRLVALGASGNEIRQLVERQAVTLTRMLRVRMGALELPRTLARSHWQELDSDQLAALTKPPPASDSITAD
ncbi:MAG TPA: S4 domain-containing protein [Steroidobacteraceae bacterium]|jgi:23S rRNA pseudouridine2605 synthase|nr:S4 domain-containing protein [Steroidobacteraceae bacterium]